LNLIFIRLHLSSFTDLIVKKFISWEHNKLRGVGSVVKENCAGFFKQKGGRHCHLARATQATALFTVIGDVDF
jgi:hypothetical protein